MSVKARGAAAVATLFLACAHAGAVRQRCLHDEQAVILDATLVQDGPGAPQRLLVEFINCSEDVHRISPPFLVGALALTFIDGVGETLGGAFCSGPASHVRKRTVELAPRERWGTECEAGEIPPEVLRDGRIEFTATIGIDDSGPSRLVTSVEARLSAEPATCSP